MQIVVNDKTINFQTEDLEDEVDVINLTRDLVQKHFAKEIQEGKTLLFNSWDLKKGEIEYELK